MSDPNCRSHSDAYRLDTPGRSRGLLRAGMATCLATRHIDTWRNHLVRLGHSPGGIMQDMGTFRIDVEIENPARSGERRLLRSVLVDTGAELSWVPADVLES